MRTRIHSRVANWLQKVLSRGTAKPDSKFSDHDIPHDDVHAALKKQGYVRDSVREDAMWSALCPGGFISAEFDRTPTQQYFIKPTPDGASEVAAIHLKPDCRLTSSCKITFSKLGANDSPTQPPPRVDKEVRAAEFLRTSRATRSL